MKWEGEKLPADKSLADREREAGQNIHPASPEAGSRQYVTISNDTSCHCMAARGLLAWLPLAGTEHMACALTRETRCLPK